MTSNDLQHWRFVFDERAALLEYEVRLPRAEAENIAWHYTIAKLGNPPDGLTLEACRR